MSEFFCRIKIETPTMTFTADHTNPHLVEATWAAIDAARMEGLQWPSKKYLRAKQAIAAVRSDQKEEAK